VDHHPLLRRKQPNQHFQYDDDGSGYNDDEGGILRSLLSVSSKSSVKPDHGVGGVGGEEWDGDTRVRREGCVIAVPKVTAFYLGRWWRCHVGKKYWLTTVGTEYNVSYEVRILAVPNV